jgi:putative transposase
MSKSKHTEAQMIGALKQLEAGRKAEDVAREVGVSKHTIYAWKGKYGGMEVSEAQEAKQLAPVPLHVGPTPVVGL